MIGNYAFMLLTGYFSVSIDKISLSSIFKLHKKYFFYSVLMDAVLIFCTCSLINIFVSVVLEKLILKRK